jgi:hypothetical protein
VFGCFLHFISAGQFPTKTKYSECEGARAQYQIVWRHRVRLNAVAMPREIA